MNSEMSYFLDRNVNIETIKKFKLGFCSDGKIVLANSIETNWKSYLSGHRKNIQNNFIFPILDLSGRANAMVFRPMNKKEFYSNSGFEKTNHLYGLHDALNSIHSRKFAIVVEGLFDTLVGHSLDLKNVVGVFGNKISVTQACLLKRFCNKVLIIGDGDKGGVELINQGTRILRNMNMEVKSLYVPTKDPDDLFISAEKNFKVF